MAGLITVFGVVIFVGTILRWNCVFQMQGIRPLGFLILVKILPGWKGFCTGIILLSIIMVICGLVLFLDGIVI